MPVVVLVRHAAATGQADDAPLTTQGHSQAGVLADLLVQLNIERVICGPSLRAMQSADPFCKLAGLHVEIEGRLAERVLSVGNLPDWREHLRRSFDDLDYSLEHGESSRAAQNRGTSAILAASVTGQSCAFVTHGNLLALILKSVDATVGFDFWSRLSTPDAFVLHFDDHGLCGFSRIWQDAG